MELAGFIMKMTGWPRSGLCPSQPGTLRPSQRTKAHQERCGGKNLCPTHPAIRPWQAVSGTSSKPPSTRQPAHISSRTIEPTPSTSADGPRSGTRDFGGAGSISTTSGFLAALAFDLADRSLGDRCRLSSVSVNDGRVSPMANAIFPCCVTVNPSSSRCGSPRLFACTPSKSLRKASRMGISCSLSFSTSTNRRLSTCLAGSTIGYLVISHPFALGATVVPFLAEPGQVGRTTQRCRETRGH
jgi:hypothetical protein